MPDMPDTSAEDARARLVEGLHAVAAGDKAALKDVYDRTSAKLLGVCLRILDNRDEAEDVLQDVYLIVWNKADRFDAERASPITWLSTIARNRAIDRARQLGPRMKDRPVEEAGDLSDGQPNALELLQRNDESRLLADCMNGLDERTRSSISRAFFGGLTYEELAHRAAMPLGTMKSIIRRGLIKLKECLSE